MSIGIVVKGPALVYVKTGIGPSVPGAVGNWSILGYTRNGVEIDRNLFDFEGLRAETAGEIAGGGDIAFDAESFDDKSCSTPEGAEGNIGLTDQPQVITFR